MPDTIRTTWSAALATHAFAHDDEPKPEGTPGEGPPHHEVSSTSVKLMANGQMPTGMDSSRL